MGEEYWFITSFLVMSLSDLNVSITVTLNMSCVSLLFLGNICVKFVLFLCKCRIKFINEICTCSFCFGKVFNFKLEFFNRCMVFQNFYFFLSQFC